MVRITRKSETTRRTRFVRGLKVLLEIFLFLFLLYIIFVLVCDIYLINSEASSSSTGSSSATTSATTKQNFLASSSSSSSSSSLSSPSSSLTDLISKYDTCTISFAGNNNKREEAEEEQYKPLWLPSYPNSVDDNIIRGIVNKITGLQESGARSYYANAKKSYRNCKGTDPIAVCMVLHPLVELRPPPMKRTSDFHSNIIYAIRNPMTTFPAFHNAKAIKYHGHTSGKQVPEQDWRNFRDEFLVTLMQQWKDQLGTWKNVTTDAEDNYYTISMYLPYEQIMNFQRETIPQMTIRRLINVLKNSGFDDHHLATEDEIPCIWYQAVGKENFQKHNQFGYEYTDYLPGYTKDQQDFLLREIDSLIKEHSKDNELVMILNNYYEEIRDHIRIDIAGVD